MGKKRLVFSGLAVTAVFLIVACVFYIHSGNLQMQIDDLAGQNEVFQAQNSALQTQLNDLQTQNREQQDRLSDYTYQLALERPMMVKITAAYCSRGWSPLGGVTGSFPANVTIVNTDVVPLCGLTVSFRFIDKDNGVPVGYDSTLKIGRLNVGESRVVNGSALANIDTNVDRLACKITLQASSIVLDTWTQDLT